MREGKIFGKQVVMNEKDWERCLRRVDAERAKVYGERYKIHVSCPFCKANERYCEECPLGTFSSLESQSWGCIRLFDFVAKEVGAERMCVGLDDAHILWDKTDNRDAQKILKFIHTRLLKMRKRRR